MKPVIRRRYTFTNAFTNAMAPYFIGDFYWFALCPYCRFLPYPGRQSCQIHIGGREFLIAPGKSTGICFVSLFLGAASYLYILKREVKPRSQYCAINQCLPNLSYPPAHFVRL